MSPGTRGAHNFFKCQILDDIEAKMAAANAAAQEAAAAATAAQESADTSSIATPSSAYATAAEQTEHAQHQADRDEVIVIDGPASTQDTSPSTNPFF
jgi:predicted secreted acid phosphatase